MPSPDLRQYALKLLALSGKFLLEDGNLDPTAFIVTASDQILRPLDLRDEESKLNSCKELVEEARNLNALAIISVLLARSKDFDLSSSNEIDYIWGDIQKYSSESCILMTLSGPGIKNWAASIPFRESVGKYNSGSVLVF